MDNSPLEFNFDMIVLLIAFMLEIGYIAHDTSDRLGSRKYPGFEKHEIYVLISDGYESHEFDPVCGIN